MKRKLFSLGLGILTSLGIAYSTPAYSMDNTEKQEIMIYDSSAKEEESEKEAVATGNISSAIDPRCEISNNGIMPVLSYGPFSYELGERTQLYGNEIYGENFTGWAIGGYDYDSIEEALEHLDIDALQDVFNNLNPEGITIGKWTIEQLLNGAQSIADLYQLSHGKDWFSFDANMDNQLAGRGDALVREKMKNGVIFEQGFFGKASAFANFDSTIAGSAERQSLSEIFPEYAEYIEILGIDEEIPVSAEFGADYSLKYGTDIRTGIEYVIQDGNFRFGISSGKQSRLERVQGDAFFAYADILGWQAGTDVISIDEEIKRDSDMTRAWVGFERKGNLNLRASIGIESESSDVTINSEINEEKAADYYHDRNNSLLYSARVSKPILRGRNFIIPYANFNNEDTAQGIIAGTKLSNLILAASLERGNGEVLFYLPRDKNSTPASIVDYFDNVSDINSDLTLTKDARVFQSRIDLLREMNGWTASLNNNGGSIGYVSNGKCIILGMENEAVKLSLLAGKYGAEISKGKSLYDPGYSINFYMRL